MNQYPPNTPKGYSLPCNPPETSREADIPHALGMLTESSSELVDRISKLSERLMKVRRTEPKNSEMVGKPVPAPSTEIGQQIEAVQINVSKCASIIEEIRSTLEI